jgi:hypothetical protein
VSTPNIALYAGGPLGPGAITHNLSATQQAGWTAIILSLFHIGNPEKPGLSWGDIIAAKLNIANGVDGTPVTSTITDADAVLSSYGGKLPYRVRTNSTNGQRMVSDAATLESFNKGTLTPGCGG